MSNLHSSVTPRTEHLSTRTSTDELYISRPLLEVLSVFPVTGLLGLDRLYIGQPLYAVAKLITLGGFGLWYIFDAVVSLTEGVIGLDNSILDSRIKITPHSIHNGRLVAFVFITFFVVRLCSRM